MVICGNIIILEYTIRGNYVGKIFSLIKCLLFSPARRGTLNSPCLLGSVSTQTCTDTNTRCSAGLCVCQEGYFDLEGACSK